MNYDTEMREPKVVKCVVNIGVGKGGEPLRKAEKVLEMITGQEPVETIAQKTNADLGIREGQPIGCKVTLRHETAHEFIEKAFWVKNDQILVNNFDDNGNFSFGIDDYTDFEEMSYDPDIGVFGIDISAELARPGDRIKNRRKRPKKIPDEHKLNKEEAVEFVEKTFNVEAIE